eukprot:scaffold27972_cov56-Isochrysis_galbana.AAC.1
MGGGERRQWGWEGLWWENRGRTGCNNKTPTQKQNPRRCARLRARDERLGVYRQVEANPLMGGGRPSVGTEGRARLTDVPT